MPALSRNTVLALIGATLVLHTTEEYLTFPAYLSSADRLLRLLPPPEFLPNPQTLRIALVIATVLPLGVVAWAILSPRKALLVSVLFLECILLVNAGWRHLRCLGQRRLRSWSDYSGYDQSAVRRLRATEGGEGAVDSVANGMATDRHSARAAYRGLGRFPGRISEATCPDRMSARTADRQPASGKPKRFRADRRARFTGHPYEERH